MSLKFFLYLTIITLLAGCASHESQLITGSQNQNLNAFRYDDFFNLDPNSLWELKIVQRGTEKFSGILALKKNANMLTIVLLDPTGLKLFEESILDSGKVTHIQALSFFDNHRLPEYLGKVIHRIFNKDADADSCSGKLYSLCWKEDSKQVKKSAKWGPFMVWNVVYIMGNNSTERINNIEYHSPWITTTFYLSPL